MPAKYRATKTKIRYINSFTLLKKLNKRIGTKLERHPSKRKRNKCKNMNSLQY